MTYDDSQFEIRDSVINSTYYLLFIIYYLLLLIVLSIHKYLAD